MWIAFNAATLHASSMVELKVLGWPDEGHPPVTERAPFTSGLPLTGGALKDGDPTTITDAAGRSIPHQVMPLAFWPDGSIKWLRVTMLIEPGDQLPYQLHLGQEPDTQGWPKLQVVGNGVGSEIDTGMIRFRLGGADGVVTDVRVSGSGDIVADRATGAIVRGKRNARSVVDGWLNDVASSGLLPGTAVEFRTIAGKDREITIEQAGPVEFIGRMRGRHISANGEKSFPYDVRIHAYAGLDWIQLQYGFVFDGNPHEDLITGVRVDVDGPFSGQLQVGLADGDVSLVAGVTSAVQPGLGTVDINDDRILNANLAGWASAAGKGGALGMIVREMWQQYPKAWRSAPGRIRAELWPEDDRVVLDFSRTSDGKGTGEDGGDLTADSVGVSKSHQIILKFGSASSDLAGLARYIDEGAIFYPSPEYMTGTGVLGPLPPVREDLFPRIEQSLRMTVYSLAMQRPYEGWYGFIDYGDVRTNRDANTGWQTKGRYGWRNGSADVPGLFLIQFFRSGDPLAWTFAAPYARHVMDVDTVHYARDGSAQLVGSMHRRGQDHWSGSTESQYTYGQGIALYHYLSGDLRARDILLEKIGPYAADPRQSGSANAANNCVRVWEATGDQFWLKAARRQMERHFDPSSYNNFRAYLDFLPALAQYWWLTGDEDARVAFIRQMEARMAPSNWEEDITYGEGGPYFMARAVLYWMTGDAPLAVGYPARAFRDRIPSAVAPEETWAPETVRASNSTSPAWRVGMLPYFLGPLIELGLGEEQLLQLPAHRGSSTPVTFHLGARHPKVFHASPGFKPLNIIASVKSDPLDAPFGDQSTDRVGNPLNFAGMPFGADLEVNGVPFRLIHPSSDPDREVLPVLDASSEVRIDVPPGGAYLHLLGLQVANGWWREGEPVFEIEFLDDKGAVIQSRTLRYRTDIDDFRGWHFASGAHFGRFWSLAGQPTRMLQVLTIDLSDLASARQLVIREAGNGYVGFLLAATLSGCKETEGGKVVASYVFAEDASAPKVPVVRSKAPASDRSARWIEVHDGAGLTDLEQGVASTGQGWLQIDVPNGDYMVEVELANTLRAGGGIVSICTGSHHLEAFALANGVDRLWLPARVTDGKLNLRLIPVPELETSRQTTQWCLRRVTVQAVDELPHAPNGPLPLIEFSGRNLVGKAKASKSVGNSVRYHHQGVENTIDGNPLTFYSLSARFPEDVIFDFDKGHSFSGVIMTFDPGRVATSIRVQIPDASGWRDVAKYDNSAQQTTIGIPLENARGERLRILMEGGSSHTLTIRRISVFGE